MKFIVERLIPDKGQIKPKADWRTVDSPKKRTNEFVCFCLKKEKSNKAKQFVQKSGHIQLQSDQLLSAIDRQADFSNQPTNMK